MREVWEGHRRSREGDARVRVDSGGKQSAVVSRSVLRDSAVGQPLHPRSVSVVRQSSNHLQSASTLR